MDAKRRPVPVNYMINSDVLTLSVNHTAADQPVSVTQTQTLFGAVIAGGTAAGMAACARFGATLAGVGCVGAVAFVAYLVAQGILALNRCLYISISPPGRDQLFNC
jgi:hypothetical protein